MTNWLKPLEEEKWFDVTDGWYLSCCSCGLVHEIEFKVEEGKIYVRVFRKERATAQRRRFKKAEMLNGENRAWQMVRVQRVRP